MPIYEPNRQLKLGIKIWGEMFQELKDSRELIVRLFLRDLSAKYKQAVFGNLWQLIMPFVAIGTFMYLNRAGVINIGHTDLPYPLFALIGLSVWQLFSSGINAGCQSLVNAGDMIAKVNFPRESLVFSSMAQAVFEFIVKIFMIIFLFVFYRYLPPWQIIFFPLAVLPIMVLAVGLSLILSLVNGILRDTANLINLLTTFLMFLTPVLYPLTNKNFLLFKLNPLSALVSAPRDLIMYGRITQPLDFCLAAVVSFLSFFIFWRVFHIMETKIPEKI